MVLYLSRSLIVYWFNRARGDIAFVTAKCSTKDQVCCASNLQQQLLALVRQASIMVGFVGNIRRHKHWSARGQNGTIVQYTRGYILFFPN